MNKNYFKDIFILEEAISDLTMSDIEKERNRCLPSLRTFWGGMGFERPLEESFQAWRGRAERRYVQTSLGLATAIILFVAMVCAFVMDRRQMWILRDGGLLALLGLAICFGVTFLRGAPTRVLHVGLVGGCILFLSGIFVLTYESPQVSGSHWFMAAYLFVPIFVHSLMQQYRPIVVLIVLIATLFAFFDVLTRYGTALLRLGGAMWQLAVLVWLVFLLLCVVASYFTELRARQRWLGDVIHGKIGQQDHLTGLWNRWKLRSAGPQMLLYAAEHGLNVSLLYTDLDNFKSVNDQHDHDVGDEMLVAFGSAAKAAMRPEGTSRKDHDRRREDRGEQPKDILVRLGGDEFLFVFVGVDELDLDSIAERCRIGFENKPVAGKTVKEYGVSASFGKMTTPGDEAGSWKALLKQADSMMIASKAAKKRTQRDDETTRLRAENAGLLKRLSLLEGGTEERGA